MVWREECWHLSWGAIYIPSVICASVSLSPEWASPLQGRMDWSMCPSFWYVTLHSRDLCIYKIEQRSSILDSCVFQIYVTNGNNGVCSWNMIFFHPFSYLERQGCSWHHFSNQENRIPLVIHYPNQGVRIEWRFTHGKPLAPSLCSTQGLFLTLRLACTPDLYYPSPSCL